MSSPEINGSEDRLFDQPNSGPQKAFEFGEMSVQDLQQVRQDIKSLLANKGFDIIQAQLMQQAQFRMNLMFNQETGGMDGVLAREYMRGHISNLNFVLNFPQTLLTELERELDTRVQEH